MSASEINQPPATTSGRIGQSIPYERFLDCVHCGLCTSACPTYVETGNENDGPRGRIYLMRSVVDGRLELTDRVRNHLDLCLDCRSCETACPSGVQYGRLLEPFRIEMQSIPPTDGTGKVHGSEPHRAPSAPVRPDWFHRWILHGLFPSRRKTRLALLPARLMQKLGLDRLMESSGLTKFLPMRLQRMQQQLPRLRKSLPELPEFLPARGPRRATVGLFIGCVADAMFRHVHWATARVLQENGCDVRIPRNQGCCGAIHYHSGASEPAVRLMNENIQAFDLNELDAVIVNVAGCGAMLKDYPHIQEELTGQHSAEKLDPVTEFGDKVKDIHEFLMALGPVPPTGVINAVVAYQDACHLQHAQKIRQQPRDLLNLIPGIRLKAVAESELCCGAAGSYNLTQPDMADRLGRRKAGHLLDVSPDVIVSGNAGCSLQLQAKLRERKSQIAVVHPMELLDLSYRKATLKELES
ncbi:MAG: 4Fe-4S dicluster domain-containing protein [Planctomyces sp.]|nr:4Fe-4S dicluster domain-containing protein [Planctomyces sp.]